MVAAVGSAAVLGGPVARESAARPVVSRPVAVATVQPRSMPDEWFMDEAERGKPRPWEDEGMTFDDLASQVGHLARLVEDKCPSGPIHDAFQPWFETKELDELSCRQLWEMRAYFFSLPMEQQKFVLNGWEPSPDQPLIEESLWCRDDSLMMILSLDAYGDVEEQERRLKGYSAGIDAYVDARFRDTTAQVQVTILEGTSRQAALEAMEKVMRLLGSDWESLLKVGAGGKSNLKSGALASPSCPQFDGREQQGEGANARLS